MVTIRWCVVVVLMVMITACGGSSTPTSPTSGSPPPTTLVILDPRAGTGALAERGRTITVNYTGWLYDGNAAEQKGRQFDTSVGRAPFTLVLGVGQVIAGWDQGLIGMRVGGLRRLVVPPALGYGSQGSGPIPGNATLVFEIELLSVQ